MVPLGCSCWLGQVPTFEVGWRWVRISCVTGRHQSQKQVCPQSEGREEEDLACRGGWGCGLLKGGHYISARAEQSRPQCCGCHVSGVFLTEQGGAVRSEQQQ